MKKLILTIAIAAVTSIATYAADGGKTTTTTGGEKIANSVINQFNADFAEAKNVSWATTANTEKATFTLNGEQMSAFYNTAGLYLGATQTIAFTAIPYYAQEDIADAYKGYKVSEVIKYTSNGDPSISAVAYFVDLKNADKELIVKVVPNEKIELFKTVK